MQRCLEKGSVEVNEYVEKDSYMDSHVQVTIEQSTKNDLFW